MRSGSLIGLFPLRASAALLLIHFFIIYPSTGGLSRFRLTFFRLKTMKRVRETPAGSGLLTDQELLPLFTGISSTPSGMESLLTLLGASVPPSFPPCSACTCLSCRYPHGPTPEAPDGKVKYLGCNMQKYSNPQLIRGILGFILFAFMGNC